MVYAKRHSLRAKRKYPKIHNSESKSSLNKEDEDYDYPRRSATTYMKRKVKSSELDIDHEIKKLTDLLIKEN
jgi:hypothetical protein